MKLMPPRARSLAAVALFGSAALIALGAARQDEPARPASPESAQPVVADGLKVWLRADALSDLDDGAKVEQWPDMAKGFIERDGAQDAAVAYVTPVGWPGTSPRVFKPIPAPTYHENAVNGLPAVRFDASKQTGLAHHDGIGLISETGEDAFTIFLVLRNTGKDGGNRVFQLGYIEAGMDDGVGSTSAAIDAAANAKKGVGVRYQNGNRVFDAAVGNEFCIVSASLGKGQTYGQTGFAINGRTPPEKETANPDGQVNLRNEGYSLGYGNWNSGEAAGFFTGDIAEVMYYQRKLSDAEMQQVGQYLAQKYGIDAAFAGRSEAAADAASADAASADAASDSRK